MAGSTVVVSVLAETSKFRKGMQELSSMAKLAGKAVAIAGAAVAALGLAELAKEAVQASDATDKFKKTLNFAGIKPDQIEALTKSTRAYADQTVYSLGEVQSITAQLAANSVPNYDKLAEAAGNLNAVAGGNAETFKRVGSVLTQTAGAGKLTTENWNQLAEAIPGASGILQKAMLENGAYTGNFRDAMARSEITAQEFNDALMNIGMSDVAREAATATDTFEGAWGNLQATIVGGIADMLDRIKPFATDGMGKLSEAFQVAGDYVNDTLLPALEGFGGWLSDNREVIGGVATVVGVLAAGLYAKAAALAVAAGATAIWTSVTTAAGAAQAFLNASMLANPIGLVVIAIAALVAGLVYFFTQTEVGRQAWAAFTEFLKSAWDAVVNWFSTTLADVQKWFSDAGNNVTKAWTAVQQFFAGLPGKIMGFFANAVSWLVNAGKGILDGLKRGAENAWGGVVSFFTGIPGKITGAIGNAGAILQGAGRAIMDGFLTGLKNSWRGVTDFVNGIATWIKNNKGPLSYDRTLLKPAGQAIMGGFLGSLKDGWGDVQDFVGSMAPELAGMFGGVEMAAPARGTVNVYNFDGLGITTANEDEANVLAEFVQFARRKARAL